MDADFHAPHHTRHSLGRRACWSALLAAAPVLAGSTVDTPQPTLQRDATIQIPAFTVPFSPLVSESGRKAFVDAVSSAVALTSTDLETRRRDIREKFHKPLLQELHSLFDVTVTPEMIGGVQTDVVVPGAGVSAQNKSRVLINLHGGGFSVAARTGGQVESIPIAGLGRIKVVTVDYRQGPEHEFPAASEDVASVYRALLKSYAPASIGIYGCSAGGILTAESLAWFQTHDLPVPGAAGIFGAGATAEISGDSTYFASVLQVRVPPPVPADTNPMRHYFGAANLRDPLVSPVYAPAVLARFPPTLIISGLRDQLLSTAVYTHTQLVKAGADADLHVWEGMRHCFFFSPRPLESREAWQVIVDFFDRRLH